MDIKNYYTFGSKLSSTTFQAHPLGLSFKKGGIGDIEKLTLGNYYKIHFPVKFKQEYGDKLHDILDTGTAIMYLISDRMRDVLEENQLTGWKAFPIQLYDKQQNEVKGYQGLSITGRCGSVNYNKSEIVSKSMINNGPISRYYRGFYIGLEDWDGSDFFLSK